MGDVVNMADIKKPESDLNSRRKAAVEKLPGYVGEVNSKNMIRKMPNVNPGEIYWVTMDNKPYLVAEKEGKKIIIKTLDESASISTGMTIYEMNKSIISKEPLFDWQDAEATKKLSQRVKTFFTEDTNNNYYLMYGRNLHYVTLFTTDSKGYDTAIDVIKDCLSAIGNLISMDFNTSDGEPSIEIWIRTAHSDAELLYLFPYDKGIVTI